MFHIFLIRPRSSQNFSKSLRWRLFAHGRLSAEKNLWIFPCTRGARNFAKTQSICNDSHSPVGSLLRRTLKFLLSPQVHRLAQPLHREGAWNFSISHKFYIEEELGFFRSTRAYKCKLELSLRRLFLTFRGKTIHYWEYWECQLVYTDAKSATIGVPAAHLLLTTNFVSS